METTTGQIRSRRRPSPLKERSLAVLSMLMITIGAPVQILVIGVHDFCEDVLDSLAFSIRMLVSGKTRPSAAQAQIKYRLVGVLNILAVTIGAPVQILVIGGKEYAGEFPSTFRYALKILRTGKR